MLWLLWIQSSNHQKLIEEKRLSNCDIMILIKHLLILNNNPSTRISTGPA